MNPRILIADNQGMMFEVESASEPGNPNIVNVFYEDMIWFCTCPDFHFRKRICKHIRQVEDFIDRKYEEYKMEV
ncbi:MAG: SWIM zinc finger family protein [Methanobrevibacter sp.]|uniref:SWIM zinc finger family protein n=1 Tax=Methanobrevibacter sp. TaxID=66852 RepID=UPI0026DFB5AF|nr:SWIM zinc finger family protein [Methanobrevibacter sp.]MDO5849275.1 SWIM zinc finger family protein [Methanobrevibacter sp.]MDO5849278.1 SWIM zinc finger family protein [Methanobrevibacter sp.]